MSSMAHSVHLCVDIFERFRGCSEPFKAALAAGDRGAVYPVLEYLLAKFSQLQKRTYLSKYLISIDIPQDILFDECTFRKPPFTTRESHHIALHEIVLACVVGCPVGVACFGGDVVVLSVPVAQLCKRCTKTTRSCRRSSRRRIRLRISWCVGAGACTLGVTRSRVAWPEPCVQKTSTLAPGDLKREIAQLTEEKNQLTEKVWRLCRV